MNNQKEITHLIVAALGRVNEDTELGFESAVWRLVDAAALCARNVRNVAKSAAVSDFTGRGGRLELKELSEDTASASVIIDQPQGQRERTLVAEVLRLQRELGSVRASNALVRTRNENICRDLRDLKVKVQTAFDALSD